MESSLVKNLLLRIRAAHGNLPHTDKVCESVSDGFITADTCYCDREARWDARVAKALDLAFDYGVMTLGANKAGLKGDVAFKTEKSFDAVLGVLEGDLDEE